jgi:hypothetical protein
LLVAAGVAALSAAQPAQPRLADLRRLFLEPPDDARIMMRWWWFGPTVTRAGLERELRLMRDGGIGGVESSRSTRSSSTTRLRTTSRTPFCPTRFSITFASPPRRRANSAFAST